MNNGRSVREKKVLTFYLHNFMRGTANANIGVTLYAMQTHPRLYFIGTNLYIEQSLQCEM